MSYKTSAHSRYSSAQCSADRLHHPVLQVAILAGDFLLARASVSLAALRDTEVIELLSQVIEHLVSGEILQACFADPPPALAANVLPSGLLVQV